MRALYGQVFTVFSHQPATIAQQFGNGPVVKSGAYLVLEHFGQHQILGPAFGVLPSVAGAVDDNTVRVAGQVGKPARTVQLKEVRNLRQRLRILADPGTPQGRHQRPG